MLKLELDHSSLDRLQADCVLVPVFNDLKLQGHVQALDSHVWNQLSNHLDKKVFDGEAGSMRLLSFSPKSGIKSALLVGLGDPSVFNLESLRRQSASAALSARASNARNLLSLLHHVRVLHASPADALEASALAMGMALYQFNHYKTQNLDKIKSLNEIRLFEPHASDAAKKALKQAQALLESIFLVRDLVNTPSNNKTPPELAKFVQGFCKKNGLSCTVLPKARLAKLGMNSFLAVNAGSSTKNPAQLVRIEYAPKHAKKTLSLVGKGITFDTGGINLKPWEGMLTMKLDMTGAATVLGIVLAAKKLELQGMRIVSYMVLTENIPGPDAIRPQDIVTAYNGKTIEVIHTDAEGRLVLADVLAYSEKNDRPDYLFDFATLTGAVSVALGRHFTGLLGNDDALLAGLEQSGQKTGEWVWKLPLTEEYKDQMKSPIADVMNIGKYKGEGGTILGAAFLSYFVEKTPWAHFDIAATGFFNDPDPTRTYWTRGASGVGVQLVIDWLNRQAMGRAPR